MAHVYDLGKENRPEGMTGVEKVQEMVNVPAFAAFGGGDINVPLAESIQRLQSLEKEISYEVYPGGGHGITDPNTGEVQIEYLNDLAAFILASD